MLNNTNLKTFFLFPQKLIFEDIAAILVAEQHEAFILNNHVEFKDALKLFNKKSVAFINIDSVLSELEWIDYVRELKEDSHFAGVKIGILSFNPDQELINIYQNDLKIDCGYHILSSRDKTYKKSILEIITNLKSKEENKILRLDFHNIEPINFVITEKGQIIKGRVDFLSSAAMSITLEHDKMLIKGLTLNNINLTYLNNNCKLSGTVIGNSQHNKNQFIIKFNTLFDGFYKEPLFKIIYQVLNREMRKLVC